MGENYANTPKITPGMSFRELGESAESIYAFKRALDKNFIMSVTSNKGVIVYANKKFCEVSGYSKNELVGKSHNIISSGHHDRDFFKNLWGKILSGQVWQGEIKNKTKNGSYYWVDTVIVPVFGKNNTIRNFLSLRTVITSRKEAELALKDAIFKLSHTMRNPLVNMQALLAICREEDGLSQLQENWAAGMQVELDRMDRITRQIVADLHEYKLKLAAGN